MNKTTKSVNYLKRQSEPIATNNIVNFCSFYSEGPPHDEAINFSNLALEILNGATGHFNKITLYTPRILRELGYGKYLKEHKLYPLSAYWSPIEKIGLSAFRPAMFLHELSQMNDGDILVHRDINCKKKPNYKNFSGYPEIAQQVLNDCKFDFFINAQTIYNTRNIQMCKAKVLRELGESIDLVANKIVGFHAYMFVMRKSPVTIQLLTEWQQAMENDSWLNGDISDEPNQHPDTRIHALDNAILSVILAKWIYKRIHNIPLNYPIVNILQDKNEIVKLKDSVFFYINEIPDTNNTNNTNNIINFCSFYSEGSPNDEALNLSDCVPEILKGATGHFNKITLYTPKKLKLLGYEKYLREYPNSNIIGHKSLLKIGLSSFRPVIFLHELNQMNDGDILIHRDINWKKYPNIGNFNNIENQILKILKECQFDFFVPTHGADIYRKGSPLYHTLLQTSNRYTVKTIVLKELGEDHPFSYEFQQVSAYMFIMKKSPVTIELLTEWKTAMENDKWLNGETYGLSHPGFRWFSLDQAILSVIIANWVRKGKYNIPKEYPGIGFDNRDINKLTYPKDYNFDGNQCFYDYLKLI